MKENLKIKFEQGNDYVTINGEKYVKEKAFEPEKKELVVGNWIVKTHDCPWIVYVDSKNNLYGIDMNGEWFNSSRDVNTVKRMMSNPKNRYATQQEVEEALKAEAVKRGYKKGNHKCLNSPIVEHCLEDVYNFEEGKLWYGGKYANCVFFNGEWSPIIQPKKMTQAEIETELGYNIEIV